MSRIAIVSASLEELDFSHSLRNSFVHKRHANFDFYEGTLHGKPLVLLITGWGKVRATQSITVLKYSYDISGLYFIGACGGIGNWKQGDICIPVLFDYFDFNAFPLLAAYNYPQFKPNGHLPVSPDSANKHIVEHLKAEFGERVNYGLALTGDSFVSDPDIIYRTGKLKIMDNASQEGRLEQFKIQHPTSNINHGAIIDMESTAIAEACTNLNIDFLITRIVSDSINADSHTDFMKFLSDTMPGMVNSILKIICK